jgi:endonuclease/exonuclease/phosphatase family metal-dependent hydrolase
MSAAAIRAAAFVLILGAAAGCGKAVNYRDPEKPRYDGRGGVAPASVPKVLRLVTFNIAYAVHVDRALVALRHHPDLRWPDVLFLQEMDAPGVEAIARALALNYAYFPVSQHPKTDRDFGNAVLSPWPIEEAWKVALPHESLLLGQARAGVGAHVRIGDRRLRVYSLHLGAPIGTSGGERKDQASALVDDAVKEPLPTILAGDFNSYGLGRYVASRGFSWITESVGITARRGPFKLKFDHILARGLRPTKDACCGVAREVSEVSDHYPVWALVELE